VPAIAGGIVDIPPGAKPQMGRWRRRRRVLTAARLPAFHRGDLAGDGNRAMTRSRNALARLILLLAHRSAAARRRRRNSNTCPPGPAS